MTDSFEGRPREGGLFEWEGVTGLEDYPTPGSATACTYTTIIYTYVAVTWNNFVRQFIWYINEWSSVPVPAYCLGMRN